jgi:hypothetical protein
MGAGEQPRTEAEALRRATAEISDRLPTGWAGELIPEPQVSTGPYRLDGLYEIVSPSGERALLVLEAKLSVAGRDVEQLKTQLNHVVSHMLDSGHEVRALVAAPYLSKPVRKRLEEAGLAYADVTGNVLIELSRPGLFLRDRGADADPWRGPGRPRGTLKGEPAARVVRALTDFNKVWTMRELAEESGASTGATYRVVDYLEREGHVRRDNQRRVHVSDWVKLLRAWSADYSLTGSNRTTRWLAPRGIPHLLKRMAEPSGKQLELGFRYAVTGTIAAEEWAPYAPASMAMTYVSNTEEAARTWGLRPTEAGANVLLLEPPYEVMLERSTVNDAGLQIAAPTQVAVDLLTGPGRSPSEAENLLAWMQKHEEAWRRYG